MVSTYGHEDRRTVGMVNEGSTSLLDFEDEGLGIPDRVETVVTLVAVERTKRTFHSFFLMFSGFEVRK